MFAGSYVGLLHCEPSNTSNQRVLTIFLRPARGGFKKQNRVAEKNFLGRVSQTNPARAETQRSNQ